MSLRATYEAFLASPSSSALADNVSINYIPTLTTINDASAVIRHLAAQGKLLHKKSERVLSTVESSDGLCVDVDTKIEFVAGGGAYLPGLDDNFLADRIVEFPVVHIVLFDRDSKICQIRQYWDQGSLLKQIEVIGARARNWPIRDGKDQSRLIANSAASEQRNPASSKHSTASSQNEVVNNNRSHSSSLTSATGDPHATLSLFQPRSINEEYERLSGPSVAPRSSAKPPTRDLANLIGGEENDPATPTNSAHNTSPKKKNNGGAPKAGSGLNYHPIRLFDENVDGASAPSPEKKAMPQRYEHFQFGQGEDASKDRQAKNMKHQSQWSFDDFSTPEKPRMKVQTQHVRTMESLGEDEVSPASASLVGAHIDKQSVQLEKSPVFRPTVHQARPDAGTHFAFDDAATPAADKSRPMRKHKNGLSLYDDNVGYKSDEDTVKQPLHPIHNVNQSARDKDFGPHHDFSDQSPSASRKMEKPNDNTAKVLKGMSSNWDSYDESPDASARKENLPKGRGIKLGGNGMGGPKGAAREWGIGDESDTESKTKPRTKVGTHKPEESKGFWDF